MSKYSIENHRGNTVVTAIWVVSIFAAAIVVFGNILISYYY